jgi:hypothetical protein
MVKRLKGRERELWENQGLTTGATATRARLFRDLEARSLAKGREEGRAEGRAEYVLRVLDRRAVPMTDDHRSRIMACTDPATLDRWLDRALDATTIEDVLAE